MTREKKKKKKKNEGPEVAKQTPDEWISALEVPASKRVT